MKANLNLGTVAGIKIKVHWTFFFLIAWIVFSELKQGGSTNSVLFNVALVLAVFLCVVLHELGHALTAKRFGIITKKITLLPIGGMASLERIPESPKEELLVTLAGPFVNIIIALILYFIIPVNEFMHLNFTETFEVLMSFTFQNFLFYLYVVNIGLVIFNIIPAFPMDGGRILRAILAMNMNRVKATQIASSIGQFIAVVFLLLGLLYNPFLIIIALFIFLGAYGENQIVQHLALLKGHNVEDAMIINITTFSPEDPIDVVVNKIISGTETNFVVVKDHKIEGILYHKNIIDNANKNVLVKDIMDTAFKTVKHTDDLKEIYNIVFAEEKSFIPVLNQEKLVGVIDATNLNEYILLQAKLSY
ncbi:site-2 protease family protein [Flaviramulus sp. BrNp1-15]|uniref:site-2 protease family protein n=1 Tax=Flaviramulus sp. BrNp1-15 TaxID=2916754 RepID=UPI001EE9011E|nr:site-2 protease family protein [Flaviramulus sp. BrNp1-15]ULC57887.1 site-2 protease family protein [Flaviramulus sp. BrNp1-15]